MVSRSWPSWRCPGRCLAPALALPNPSLSWLISWLVTGCAAMLLLLLSAAPAASWLRLAAAARVSVAIAAAAGIVALAGGQLAQELWKPLNELTVWCTYKLLSMIYGDVYIEPEQALLGVNDFVVEIAPACSGYEGMALILVFVSLYLWLFRTELKFPRALLLFPIGLVIIWLTNVLRIALLVAIGASVSPEIALGGFHSQAGWIGFSMVALGMLSLSHRYFCAVPTGRVRAPHDSESGPAAALLMPLLALMAASMLISALSGGFPTLYPLGVLVTAGTLWHFRRQYASLAGAVSWQLSRDRCRSLCSLAAACARRRWHTIARHAGRHAGVVVGHMGDLPDRRISSNGTDRGGTRFPWISAEKTCLCELRERQAGTVYLDVIRRIVRAIRSVAQQLVRGNGCRGWVCTGALPSRATQRRCRGAHDQQRTHRRGSPAGRPMGVVGLKQS